MRAWEQWRHAAIIAALAPPNVLVHISPAHCELGLAQIRHALVLARFNRRIAQQRPRRCNRAQMLLLLYETVGAEVCPSNSVAGFMKGELQFLCCNSSYA